MFVDITDQADSAGDCIDDINPVSGFGESSLPEPVTKIKTHAVFRVFDIMGNGQGGRVMLHQGFQEGVHKTGQTGPVAINFPDCPGLASGTE